MENVWVAEEIWNVNGNEVYTDVKVYKTYEDARKRFEELKNNNNKFIENVQNDINNGNIDSSIYDGDGIDYFHVYDSFSFDELTIKIIKTEVK